MTEQTKFIDKKDNTGFSSKRESAQKMTFAKFQEILQRNVNKAVSKSYTQYTKELVNTYKLNVTVNQQTLREISRFLCRYSMMYKKLIMYYASMPLFYYNITQINNLTQNIDQTKAIKKYQKVLQEFETFNIKSEGYTALYSAIRDGIYVGFTYDSDDKGIFIMPLDVEYIRLYGKTKEGIWIPYMDASFFDKGENKNYIYGVNNDGVGVWDSVFIEGYENYLNDRQNNRWFRLPPEKTLCLITCAEDEFTAPIPFFLPLFTSLLDLLDLEQLIMSKNEIENYKLIISKIPMMKSGDVDDFALSLELAEYFNQLLEQVVPEQIGVAFSPMDITPVEFEKSNTSNDTDHLAKSTQNLFNNAGASQLVVAGGSSTNSIGLKHSIQNDIATVFTWVTRFERWLNCFIQYNISDGYILEIHRITDYNKEEYIKEKKEAVSFGAFIMDYLTALGVSPYMVLQKLNFENALGIRDLLIPLKTSYTISRESSGGRPQSSDDDLSEEGLATREKGKNVGTRSGK